MTVGHDFFCILKTLVFNSNYQIYKPIPLIYSIAWCVEINCRLVHVSRAACGGISNRITCSARLSRRVLYTRFAAAGPGLLASSGYIYLVGGCEAGRYGGPLQCQGRNKSTIKTSILLRHKLYPILQQRILLYAECTEFAISLIYWMNILFYYGAFIIWYILTLFSFSLNEEVRKGHFLYAPYHFWGNKSYRDIDFHINFVPANNVNFLSSNFILVAGNSSLTSQQPSRETADLCSCQFGVLHLLDRCTTYTVR